MCISRHVWALSTHSQVARLTTVVATATGTGAAQAQSRAVSLHMTKALAVVALLGLGGARKGAAVRLVAGLLALITMSISELCGGIGV